MVKLVTAALRHLFAVVRLRGAEAAATTTGADSIRVFDVEAAAH